MPSHEFNGPYTGDHLNRIAFPLGGIGAGMFCLEGTGALSHVSLRHKPQTTHEPIMFAALHVEGAPAARVIEGPVPMWKAFGVKDGGNGRPHTHLGLPRFGEARFEPRFPFARVDIRDASMPVRVELTGWSPMTPGDADASSLPAAMLEYRLINLTDQPARCVFSFHADNFMVDKEVGRGARVRPVPGGFVAEQDGSDDKPQAQGVFAVRMIGDQPRVDCAWFRGGWYDALTMLWNHVESGAALDQPPPDGPSSRGGSVSLPLTLEPGADHTVKLLLCWHVPLSDVRTGTDPDAGDGDAEAEAVGHHDGQSAVGDPATMYHRPWYASAFGDVGAVLDHVTDQYESLRSRSVAFADAFFDTTLPAEVVEAVAANLSILKSPTVLRDAEGRLWGWEGCRDDAGSCPGACTHVWNYAQAFAHLFPSLERTLRESEFFVSQDERGHQTFRTSLPIRPPAHHFHAAADGQLGGVMKVYREWRVSGDERWMARFWPAVRRSLDYCIATWDPDHTGRIVEPHHNTYDIQFWGPDGMCTSFYAGALAAAVRMGESLGEEVGLYRTLLARAQRALTDELFNGAYVIQKVQWRELRAGDPITVQTVAKTPSYSPEARAILEREGPKYQYGDGCLSDGVLGDWLARCCGLGPVVDALVTTKHMGAVHRHNFRPTLRDHANPQRAGYAMAGEAGLLLCSWPRGNKPSLPFVYSDEVWTGIEYQAAGHLMMLGRVEEGLVIVRATRARYDGRSRNPFSEYEYGHWYARAMSSFGLLQALTGARYDAVDKLLYLEPRIPGDFRAFLATETGFGTVGVRGGRPFFEPVHGRVEVQRIAYTPCGG